MELINTITMVFAVQLGDAASTQQVPPPPTATTLQPDRRLHSTHGRKPSADAFGCIFDACNTAELGSSVRWTLESNSLSRNPLIGVLSVWLIAPGRR